MAKHRKVRRQMRRRQRKRRREQNRKLKAQGLNFSERRRRIRNRRRMDKVKRSNAVNRVKRGRPAHRRRGGGKKRGLAQSIRNTINRGAPPPPGRGAPPPPGIPQGAGSLAHMAHSQAPGFVPGRPGGRGRPGRFMAPMLQQGRGFVPPSRPGRGQRGGMLPRRSGGIQWGPNAPWQNGRSQGYYEDQVEPYYEDYYWDDPLYAWDDPGYDDPYDPSGVDIYDDYILVDVDGVDIIPNADRELWDEFQGDVLDVAGEIAGELSALSISGVIGDATDPVGLLHELGRKRIVELKLFAEVDGWSEPAYLRDAEVVVEAVNELQEAMEDAAAVAVPDANGAIAGVHIGAAGALALAAIPALAAIAPSIIASKQKQQDRQLKRRSKRRAKKREREANREAKQQDRMAQLEQQRADLEAQGRGAGIYDLDEGEWGAKAQAGGVSVRAKVGKRAAIAELGNGYYLVKEAFDGVSEVALVGQMQAAVQAAQSAIVATPAAIQGPIDIAGCGANCAGNRRLEYIVGS